MRNKIFLTSMLALMVACPAVASLFNDPDVNSMSGQIAANSTQESCASNPLQYQVPAGEGASYGTYTLTAQWNEDECGINLNSHTGTNEYGSTASSPTDLYAVFGDAVYLEQAHTNAMSTSANGLTTNPTGKTYTLTLNPNLPGSHQVSEISGSTGYAASTNATMTFAGFYSDAQSSKTQTNGTQYITNANTGKITSAGITAGTGISKVNGNCPNTTWHAQYTCTNADTYTPVLTGYTFNGWYDAATGGNVVSDFCLDSNKTVWAHWTADSCTVTYNPTSHSTNPSATAVTNTATYDAPYSVPTTAGRGGAGTLSAPATGYSFVGWTTDTEANMTVTRTGNTNTGTVSNAWTWTDTNNWTSTTCPTLYAAYIPNQYTVTYDCDTDNGGSFVNGLNNTSAWPSGTIGEDYVDFGTNYDLRNSSQTCEKSGFDTGSWNCYLTGTPSTPSNSVSTPLNQPWDLTYDITCVASYSQNTYKIYYECGAYGGGNVAGTVDAGGNQNYMSVVYQDDWYILATPNGCQTPAGAHFAGWHCTVNPATGLTDTGQIYYSFNAIIPSTGLYANTYAAVYASGTNYYVFHGNSYNYQQNITCTAQWVENKVNIVWNDDNDPTNGSDTAHSGGSSACNYGGAGVTFDVPSAPTKVGYTFNGWKVTNWQ